MEIMSHEGYDYDRSKITEKMFLKTLQILILNFRVFSKVVFIFEFVDVWLLLL
jgi:hypothetical protein